MMVHDLRGPISGQMGALELLSDAKGLGDSDRRLLEAAERIARNDFPLHDKRPVITHSNFMSLEAVRKMAELGVGANMQPAWLWLGFIAIVAALMAAQHFQSPAHAAAWGVFAGGIAENLANGRRA